MMSTYGKVVPEFSVINRFQQKKKIPNSSPSLYQTLYAVIVIDGLYCIISRQFIISPAEQMMICERSEMLTGLCGATDVLLPQCCTICSVPCICRCCICGSTSTGTTNYRFREFIKIVSALTLHCSDFSLSFPKQYGITVIYIAFTFYQA